MLAVSSISGFEILQTVKLPVGSLIVFRRFLDKATGSLKTSHHRGHFSGIFLTRWKEKKRRLT